MGLSLLTQRDRQREASGARALLTAWSTSMTPRCAWPTVVQISTSEYKISPLKKAARELLGYPHPRRVPRGMYIEQSIGISTDEFSRAKDSGVRYLRNVFR